MQQRNMVRNRRPQIEIPNRQSGIRPQTRLKPRLPCEAPPCPLLVLLARATRRAWCGGRCAGTTCAPRDGRLPACARDVCVAGRAPAAESALRGTVRVDVRTDVSEILLR